MPEKHSHPPREFPHSSIDIRTSQISVLAKTSLTHERCFGVKLSTDFWLNIDDDVTTLTTMTTVNSKTPENFMVSFLVGSLHQKLLV